MNNQKNLFSKAHSLLDPLDDQHADFSSDYDMSEHNLVIPPLIPFDIE